jgi:hypothetical protein
MSRTIKCYNCGKFCGEIENGSKLIRGLSYICKECRELIKIKTEEINKISGIYDSDMPDFFKGIFK